MSEIRRIIDRFSISELQVNSKTKRAIRILTEYIHETHASFPNVIRIASLLIDSCREELRPTDEFMSVHPENRPEVYSSLEVYLTFYLLMLVQKADNLYHIEEEKKRGVCRHLSIIHQNDKETCSFCAEKNVELDIADATVENVPPYHVGCRCGILITK